MRKKKSSFLSPFLLFIVGGIGGLGCLVLSLLFIPVILLGGMPGAPVAQGSPQAPSAIFPGDGILSVQPTHAWTGPRNQAVVNAALYVASGLSNGPPDNLDTWYRTDRIPAAVKYWQTTCAGCSAWQQGQLQCVMLITAAYGLAGQPLPYVGNAITFWTSGAYNQPGWDMIPPSGLPYPGDMAVLDSPYFDGVGHIAIIVDVKLPDVAGQGGYVQFAEANGPGPLVQMPFALDAQGNYVMGTWKNYTVKGYIRHSIVVTPF
jgi:CHAP domain-containing protein